MKTEKVDTVVIGGGQAGLAVGYYLHQQKRDFIILDTHDRAGDSWRRRWDSLRLFTPTGFNDLPGMSFPKSGDRFPTKDQMADYLESYIARFELPILFNTSAEEVTRDNNYYLITTNTLKLEANHVIVATGAHPTPFVPAFANELDPAINQLHSADYRNPSQLQDGDVLVVGAGNSAVEIALDLASRHSVWLAGRDTGFIPANYGKLSYELGVILFKALMQHLNIDTLPGCWVVQRAREFTRGDPVVGVTPEDLLRAGIQRMPRVTGVNHGRPVLKDGNVLDVPNIIWSTGFVRDYRWIKLPILDEGGKPIQHRGVVPTEPGLYFVGLPHQSSVLSGLVVGAGADAKYIARQINIRAKATGLARGEKVDRLSKQASSTS